MPNNGYAAPASAAASNGSAAAEESLLSKAAARTAAFSLDFPHKAAPDVGPAGGCAS